MLFFDELDELEAKEHSKAEEDLAGTAASDAEACSVLPGGDWQTQALERHSCPISVTVQEARKLQGQLLRECAKAELQERLHEAWRAAAGEPGREAAVREELRSGVEVRVAGLQGLAASREGGAVLRAALELHAGSDAEVAHQLAAMQWLLDPHLQATEPVPKGPGRFTIFSTARVFAANGTNVCRIEVHISDTIRCLKENIYLTTRKSWMTQKLFIGETELFDQVILSSLMRVGAATDFRLEYRRPEVVEWLVRVKQHGAGVLSEAPAELVAEPEFILPAVQMQAQTLAFAAPELLADRSFLLQIAPHCGQTLRFAAEALRSDRAVVAAAVTQDAWALELAAPELRADRELVLMAVRLDGWALQFAAAPLQADSELVQVAIQKDPSIILKVMPELQRQRSVVIRAVQQDWRLFESLVPEMRDDREVALAAVRQSGWALQHASPARRADRDVVIEALRNHGDALRFVASQLHYDREVMLTAAPRSVDGVTRAVKAWMLVHASVGERGPPAARPGHRRTSTEHRLRRHGSRAAWRQPWWGAGT